MKNMRFNRRRCLLSDNRWSLRFVHVNCLSLVVRISNNRQTKQNQGKREWTNRAKQLKNEKNPILVCSRHIFFSLFCFSSAENIEITNVSHCHAVGVRLFSVCRVSAVKSIENQMNCYARFLERVLEVEKKSIIFFVLKNLFPRRGRCVNGE